MWKILIAIIINCYLLLLQISSGVLYNEYTYNTLFSARNETYSDISMTDVGIL